MKKIFILSMLLFSGLIQSGFAQEEQIDQAVIQKIREEGLNKSQVMQTAFYLTDVSGARLPNSPGLRRAQDWAINALKTWGIPNAGLEGWGKFGKGWEIQKNYAAITVPYYHAIIAAPKAWTPGTDGLLKAEVVLIKVDTISDLDQYKGKLKGKVIIFDVNTSMNTSFKSDGMRFSEEDLAKMAAPPAPRAANAPAFSTEQMANLRKQRALRAQINELLVQEGAGLILSNGRGSHGTFFTSNGASYAMDAKPVLPELEVSQEDFLRILRLVKAGQKVELEADLKTRFHENDELDNNLIAEIPGTDKKLKEEVVMLGAHLDSWHAATGATDNAAGSAVMLEAMRILKAINFKPKRTIRIALWSAEEEGLYGSRNYVLKHFGDPKTMELKPEQAKVSAYYNLDNGTGKIRGVYLQGNEKIAPIFKAWLAPFADLGANTITPRNTGGTDHLSFDAVGIPGFQFIQDPIEYNTRTHHTNMDTYDRLIEADLKQAATIIASFVYHSAQRADMLPRKELPKAQAARQ
ncbi:MAG: hypothetical protein RI924_534 [Bacteroidota bacterium]|jgi:hypothetical protein